ncbi:hypothetical protein COJ48_06160 [Bacillus cereus]|uniref:hypothetical protein n=1 Tax=Bacillus paramycoides TaxID=2026194 RepID=UPI000BF6CFF6|nr:hypothetical protein [Bacillus paramycoides]NWK68561.1 hypothetical protein [Bacillus paramycoides]PFM66253.1 hypothetical protein COJ48_06160 [Bacillus cereus]PGP85214.1 hypothetical protein CN997_08290 [Bacillus cereus]
MKYSHEFWRDPFGGLRIHLPKEIAIVSHFIENLYEDEVDEYIEILDHVVEGKHPNFELEYNAAGVFIEPEYTIAINYYISPPNNQCKLETSEFRRLLLLWRDKVVTEGRDIDVD